MKKMITLVGVAVLISTTSYAHISDAVRKQYQNTAASVSYKDEAGDCKIPSSQYVLDINNVRTRLLNAGDAWWDLDRAKYEVPKGDGNPGVHSIFAGAIWISGRDAGNNLKLAALTFRSGQSDFFAGPLDNTGNIDAATCNMWDKHFNVYGSEIAALQAAPEGAKDGAITDNIKYWPGKGNAAMVAQGYNMNQNLAPFWDNDLDGIYDPTKGDYPTLKDSSEAFADQMVYWVFNDKGNVHSATNGVPMGIQSNTVAFAFQTTDEVNNMTFYSYNIINKGGETLKDAYMSQYVDPDLGCSDNDYVGCDTTRSLAFVYNGLSNDGVGCIQGSKPYLTLPMLGFDFFEGPIDTNGQQKGMSSFVYFTRTATTPHDDPATAVQFRNYQEAKWKDGSPFTYGGLGYGGTVPVKYCFPGNPSNTSEWSECNPQTGTDAAADRRFAMTSGPFTFLSNATQRITIGVIFVQPQGGVGLCPNVNEILGPADDKAQALFNSGFKLLDGPDAPTVKIRELDKKLILNLINEKAGNNFGESYKVADASIYTQTGFTAGGDSFYTFQGYKIYQLVDQKVSATDLDNPEKAMLVAQYDVKDGLSRLINYVKDPITQLYIPTVKVEGKNEGINRSIEVEKDLFTDKELVNHRTYYYAAVAYASNNFKQYEQGNPSAGGQTIQYLQGRKFARYSAVPHAIDPRNGGTELQAKFGDAVQVKRVEGQANAGNQINLTKETLNKIISSGVGFADTLDYEVGSDPIGFRVIDPVALKEADFELQFKDTMPYNGYSLSPKAWWTLRVLGDNGQPIDSVDSEALLGTPYQQQIALTQGTERIDYGFSLSVGIPFPAYDTIELTGRPAYGAIGGTITYTDENKKWLSFVADEGATSVTNWIRSGNLRVSADADPNRGVFDDNFTRIGTSQTGFTFPFNDEDKKFDKIAGGTWAPYCLAASYHYSGTPPDPATPIAVHGPGFKWDKWGGAPFLPNPPRPNMMTPRNTLDRLQSVDIIITPDKSKWSQCVVFETGEEIATVQGGSRKGMLRMAPSRDKDGNSFIDPLTGEPDTGRSYFPGYAVNVETGQRLNIAFGESSEWPEQNGADMLWNPTDKEFGDINYGGVVPYIPFFGGKHFIYVMETPYDEGLEMRDDLARALPLLPTSPIAAYPAWIDTAIYRKIMYTSIPFLTKGYSLKSLQDGLVPDEVTVRLRVERPLAKLATNTNLGESDSMPRYRFSTKGLAPKENVGDVAKSALDNIRFVPNPYLAYSAYESSAADTRVRITNLPNNCTVSIYTLDGTLVKTLRRAVNTNVPDPATGKVIELSDGVNIDNSEVNIESTVDWDLKNEKSVPVASGVYLFDINAPGIGHKILKWFGAMRPADVSNF